MKTLFLLAWVETVVTPATKLFSVNVDLLSKDIEIGILNWEPRSPWGRTQGEAAWAELLEKLRL